MEPLAPSTDHIDPLNSDHVCGLDIDLNKITETVSYNAAKSNKFVPYRIELFGAPKRFGDIGEFLINDQWVVCEFGGDKWHAETRRIGCAQNKHQLWRDNPKLHSEISSHGGKAAVAAGHHYGANGCHTSENQRARIAGKLWWHNPETGETTRALERPEGYARGRPPEWIEKMKANLSGRVHCYSPETGETKLVHDVPEGWVKGRKLGGRS